jgi:hypothetical protein
MIEDLSTARFDRGAKGAERDFFDLPLRGRQIKSLSSKAARENTI